MSVCGHHMGITYDDLICPKCAADNKPEALEHGGPAFPLADTFIWKGDRILSHHPGMTLRDYFAAGAITGICGNSSVDYNVPDAAALAYEIADAMLEAREPKPPQPLAPEGNLSP